MKKQINIPKFKNEDVERDYWMKFDLSQFAEKEDFKPVSFPNLKPSSTPISIRLPLYIIYRLKEKANKINIPYQALIKQYIAKGLKDN